MTQLRLDEDFTRKVRFEGICGRRNCLNKDSCGYHNIWLQEIIYLFFLNKTKSGSGSAHLLCQEVQCVMLLGMGTAVGSVYSCKHFGHGPLVLGHHGDHWNVHGSSPLSLYEGNSHYLLSPRAYLQESKGFHRGLQFFWEVAWDHMALYAVLFNALFSIWHLISSLCMHACIVASVVSDSLRFYGL